MNIKDDRYYNKSDREYCNGLSNFIKLVVAIIFIGLLLIIIFV